MPSSIPKSRDDLIYLVETRFSKLKSELEQVSEQRSTLMCDEDFSIKDVLAVRLWWTRAVMEWIAAGRAGKAPVTPAEGYTWRETPALNKSIAAKSRKRRFAKICGDLAREQKRILRLIDSLSAEELTEPGYFEWAGKWPIMRWISISTSSQYDGARKLIRKALKQAQD